LPFSWWAALALLAALTLAVYLGSAWTPALLDDADSGHAVVSKEILERGDWVTFYINGVRYLEKAPLLFWTGAIACTFLGINELATRLPLVLAVLGTVLLAAAFARRVGGDRAGLYAGLALASSFGLYLFTRIFIPDILLTFFITAAMYCFWRARDAPVFAFGFWVATAGAVLSKGLIGVVFPLAAAGLLVLLTGEWHMVRRMRPLAGPLLFLLLAAPWHILASLRTPHFAWFYFVNEHFLRYLGRRYPQDYDKVPLFLFWAMNLVWLFPWSVYLPLAVRREEGKNPAPLLWWIWAGTVLVFFSFSTRQEYYTMPAYPALALLLGCSLARSEARAEGSAGRDFGPLAGSDHGLRTTESPRRRPQTTDHGPRTTESPRRRPRTTDHGPRTTAWLVWLQAILAALGVVAAISLAALLWFSRDLHPGGDIASLLSNNPQYYKLSLGHMFDLKPETFAALRWPAASAAAVLGLGFPLAWWLRRRGRHLAASLATAATAAAFLLCAHAALVVFEPRLSSRPLAVAIERVWRPGNRIVLDGEYYLGSSLGFYLKPKLFLLNGRMTGLEFGSRYPDCPPVFIGDTDIQRWWDEPTRVFLVTDQEKRAGLENLLPSRQMHIVAASGGKFVFSNLP
jgi:hypothetical protein